MPQFAVLAKGTIEGRKNISKVKKNFAELSAMFKAKDAVITNAYAIMGEYDLMFLTEAPDLNTAFELSTMIGTLGSLECQTYPIMPLEELFEMI